MLSRLLKTVTIKLLTLVKSCLHQGLSLKSRQKSLRSRHREDRLSKAIETELLGTEQAVAGIT